MTTSTELSFPLQLVFPVCVYKLLYFILQIFSQIFFLGKWLSPSWLELMILLNVWIKTYEQVFFIQKRFLLFFIFYVLNFLSNTERVGQG